MTALRGHYKLTIIQYIYEEHFLFQVLEGQGNVSLHQLAERIQRGLGTAPIDRDQKPQKQKLASNANLHKSPLIFALHSLSLAFPIMPFHQVRLKVSFCLMLEWLLI